MGTACARCSEVQKGKAEDVPGLHPDVEEAESGGEGSDGDRSEEIVASSGDEADEDGYKQGVEEILKTTGKNIKRGKTMALKEAISTAKKYGLETSTISEAEKQLTEHKKQQLREEVEKEVEAFFASAACDDISSAEKMVRKAVDADCRAPVLKRVQDRLDELIITRTLEEDEEKLCRSYLKQSCREFVEAATKAGGRQVIVLDLDDGRRVPSSISLDPPLQHVLIVPDREDGDGSARQVPISKMRAGRAQDDKKLASRRGFVELEDEDLECAVSVRYEGRDRLPAVLCLLEPTRLRRDRLIEALLVLTLTCA
mmetsp:Transcript_106248/g.307524  ORF Transcript_106248/g.307524 Transcript_106248/m.307524 type:complete len:313 (+) Transcript_106248:91-1029(+)